MLNILGIYFFIVLGFWAKKAFKEVEGKTLVILSTYFLQPYLTLWGIMLVKIDKELILAPVIYLIAVFLALVLTFTTTIFLKDKKEKIIASLMPLIGNTGNFGIPISYMLFGDIGASIATLVNLANIFFIYSFGIFFFASGEYSFKEAFKKIVKIPVMWFGVLALALNLSGVRFGEDIMKILQMGAYASIVIQLLIFGIYVAEIKFREVSLKLTFITVLNKFVVFPFTGFILLQFFHLNPIISKVVLIEVLTPLAVTNVNLAALFNIYPQKVAYLVIISTIIFLIIAPFI